MMSAVRSAMPPRFARLTFSVLVLALIALLLPTTARTQTITTGGAISVAGNQSTPQTGSSTVTVSGAPGPVATVKVQLQGVKSDGESFASGPVYNSMAYAEFLLESPGGEELVLLGQTGDTIDGCDENENDQSCDGLQGTSADVINIQDGAHQAPIGAGSLGQQWEGWQTGNMPYTVEPTSSYIYNGDGPPPLPTTENTADYPQPDGSATLTGRFATTAANGTWTLYLIDNDDPTDPVSITGWTLTLTYGTATPTTTTLSANASNPAYYANTASSISIQYTATLSPSSATGTVAFSANGSTISGCSAVAVSSGVAHCTVSLAQGNNSITAEYTPTGVYGQSSASMTQLVEVTAANTSGTTWCNNSLVSVPANDNPGLSYPSTIGISGYTGGTTVSNVTVELEGIQGLTSGMNGQFLLVAPGGTQDLVFLEDGFQESGTFSGVNLTFEDSASGYVPYNTGTPGGGPYLATDDSEGVNPDTFTTSTSPSIDSGVPQVPGTLNFAPPYGSDNSVYTHTNILTFGEAFNGASANGKWALYTVGPYAVNLNSGWCITLSLNTGTATTTTVTSSQNPQATGQSVTITATVKVGSTPVPSGGTVTFTDTTGSTPVTLASGVAVNGSGQASFSTSTLTEGDHEITANYSGTSSDNASFGSMWQRINTATTASQVSSSEWQYCDTGAVEGLYPNPAGPFTPNPSVITVSNLPGTLNTVTVQLTSFSVPVTENLDELESLVEGPTGAALDFFSNTTQGANGTSEASAGNYIFADSAGSLVSSGNTSISPSTYKPTAYESYLAISDSFTSSTSGQYPAPTSFSYATSHGSATFASVFTNGSNANGTWNLFFNTTDGAQGTIGAANGWCVNLTENLPTVSISAGHSGTFTQGQQGAQLTATVTNNGAGSTGDPTGSYPLTVTDTLPTGLSYANNSSGSGWSCSGSSTVTCTNHSSIGDGSQYPTLTIYVNVAGNAPASVSNGQSASGGGASNTPTSNDGITIDPAPALSVTKTHIGTFTQSSTAEWDISVSNTLSGSTTNGTTTVSDTLPSGYSANNFGSTSVAWSCSGATTVTCTSTSGISGGNSFPQIQVIVNVAANSPVSVSNTALAWGGGDLTHTNSGNAASGSDNNVTVVQVPASITANAGTTPQSAPVTTAFGTPLAATVLDGGSNPIQGVSVTFTAPGAGASGIFSNSSNTISVNTNASGVANAGTFTANATPGAYSVTASVAGLGSTASFSLTNNPGAAAYFVIPGGPEPFYTAFSFSIYAYDAEGNLATSYNGTVAFTSSDPGFVNLGPVTLVNGVGSQTGVLKTAGVDTITATDVSNSSITGTGSFTIQPGAATHLGLIAPSSAIAGAPFNFTVTAYDLYGNVATSYGGTVVFTSTDPAASLPGSSAITNGMGTFGATFNTAGAQTITATDSVNALIATSSGTTVTIPNLVVTTPNDDAGTAGNCTVQTTPGTGTDASCSLRDALLFAAGAGSGSITFDSTAFGSAQTILLTNGQLNIPSNTSIAGPTTGTGNSLTNLVTVNGNAASTVFSVNSGVTNSSLSGLIISNGSSSSGGGIANGGILTITGSTISGNTVSSTGGDIVFGGGIENGGTLTITGSTISGNSATTTSGGQAGGGGISNSGTLTLNDSTVSGNAASAAGNGGGAGIVQTGGTLALTNSTISANTADGAGGGIYINAGTVTLANTIVSGNSQPTGTDLVNGGGTLNDSGGNQLNLSAAAINLAQLFSYGGPTQTMLPLPGSPALCGGTLTNAAAISGDQRGLGFDPNCPVGANLVDSGAVQTNYGLAVTPEPPSSVTVGSAFSLGVSLFENGYLATAASSSITMTDTAGALGGTTTANLSSGSAPFGNLSLSPATTNDVLIATLSLNPSLAPPLNLTANSTDVTANQLSQTINWPTITGTQYALTQLTLSATAPGGTVSFTSTTPTVCTVAAGSTTASLLLPGPCTIQANQSGGTLYSAAPMVQQSFTVYYQGATMSSPTPGALTASSATFNWSAGSGVGRYEFRLGTTGPGSQDLDYLVSPTALSSGLVSNIPTYGMKLYARLYSEIKGAWQYQDYTYTESGAPVPAALTSPPPGSKLSGSSATFGWTAGGGVGKYEFRLGTTGPNSDDLDYLVSPTALSSGLVSNIPTYGLKLYARLYSEINGVWQWQDYTYTESGPLVLAALNSPTPGSTLSGASATFDWTAGEGVGKYEFRLGTTGPGSQDLDYLVSPTALSSGLVSNIPTNGGTLFARLYSEIEGVWHYQDYTYTEFGTPVPAALTSPPPGSTLSGSSITFGWTAGSGVTKYEFLLGTTGPGSDDLDYLAPSTALSSGLVSNIPTNGKTVYVRLYSLIDGAWQYQDYTYTEQ